MSRLTPALRFVLLLCGAVALPLPTAIAATPGPAVSIELATGTPAEHRAAAQLRRLLARYDLSPFLFTTRVRIAAGAIPHSHPVLTLNTRHLHDDERQLATFLHEQLHWYAVAHHDAVDAAVAELRARYRDMPVGHPAGARSPRSGYLHLVVNLLELDALARYLGRERARAVLRSADYYTWIYATVLADTAEIRAILQRHGLTSR